MKYLKVILAIILLCAFCLTASAHSGKTDSNGGHYDKSTGEYHYHHGYSAHDHYDIDGDGIKDCPYNFRDNTDHSGSSSGAKKEVSLIQIVITVVAGLVCLTISGVLPLLYYGIFYLIDMLVSRWTTLKENTKPYKVAKIVSLILAVTIITIVLIALSYVL